MVKSILIETDAPGDSRTMFRLSVNGSNVAYKLTAAQAHLFVGDVLETREL